MESIKELKIKCQSGKRSKDFLLMKGYTFHREVSIYVTKFLLTFFPKIKPNTVSFLMIFVSLIGCLLLLSSCAYTAGTGIFLVYLGFILDKVDGEIARYKNTYSLRGGYLDEVYHMLIPNLLLICFLFPALMEGRIAGLIFLIIILLNLMNRFNRKISLIISVKLNRMIKDGLVKIQKENNFINKFFNLFIFKIFSLIERFDLIILSIILIIPAEIFLGYSLRVYYLYIYFIFSLIYFTRWTFLNYFGNLEKEVDNLIKRGY